MLKRLIAVWIDYRVHYISEVATKCLLGALLLSLPVATSTLTYATHHKAQTSHKPAASHLPKSNKHSAAVKKVAVATPPPSTTSPPPTPPPPKPKPIPVPATQPAPGSGAKKLAPAPASSPAASSSSSSPTTTSSTSASPPSSTSTPTYATGGYTSTNWVGYVATAGNYKHISSSWVVPSATGNGTTTTADSTWIGIGGVSSNDLIQTGTSNIISPSGQVSTSAFYELLPDPALDIPSISVSAGDSMSATIDEESAGTWLISISDNTTGQSFSTTVTYASSYSSAEWIEEDPSYTNGSLVPFDRFSPAEFTSAKVSINGVVSTVAAVNGSPITLVDQAGNPLARPTVLSTDGAGFGVYRQ